MPATALFPSDRAPGLLIAAGVELPDDAWIGGGVIVHGEVTLGPGCIVQDHVVLGMRMGSEQDAARTNLPTRMGAAVTICASVVVHEGTTIGDHSLIGDQARVAQRAQIGAHPLVGPRVTVSHDTRIGDRVRIQHAVNIAPPGIVEDDVFIGPSVVRPTTPRPIEWAPTTSWSARSCVAAVASARPPRCSRVEVGEEAFAAAGSLVTRDVPARTVVMGRPARHVRAVEGAELLAARNARLEGAPQP